MADVSVMMRVGAVIASATRSPTDARMVEFVDDLVAVSGMVPDGGGGERPVTRQEAADQFAEDVLSQMVSRARNLKRDRLASAADGL